MWNLEEGTDKPIFRAGIEAQTQRTNMWTWEGGGEGGTNWESGIDIYAPPCVKQTASGNLLYTAQRAQLSAL